MTKIEIPLDIPDVEIERLNVLGIDEISLKKELPKEEYKKLKGAMWILRRDIEELTGKYVPRKLPKSHENIVIDT